ncbi:MAG: ATP-binding protein [Coriobacteriia bacterium]|nr:ATP-binding protein [Coriobacteriia bacterium]
MRVLVVDDDDSGRYLLASLLTGHGHSVVEARDGREALEHARAQAVDIVVTDILMPVMDGYTLAREWKSDASLSSVPILFYTASYTDPADRRFAESLGVDGFFVKPQEPDVLLHLIEEAYAQNSVAKVTTRAAEPREETEVLREYSERLVSKLEQKVAELDRTNQSLTQALEVITDEVDVKKTLIEQLTRDIVDRERAEADLSAANEALLTVVTAAPLAIVGLDTEFKVTVWNPAAERVLGWSASQAMGRFYAPAAGDGEAEFRETYGPLMRGEVETMARDVRRRRADGTEVDLRVHVAALHGVDGRVSGLLSIFQDVTEQRHIEMLKSDFVSMVSHELRTPLTSIIGYSDLLEQVDLRAKPELFHQLLGKIRDRGDRMRRLIDDLLAVSQVQSGPLRLDLERAEVAGFVRESVERACTSERHHLVFSAEDDLPTVFIDRVRLGKVIAHIVENAVKYSPDGGDIVVDVTGSPDGVRISVADPGIGIDAVDREHVFDRFTQADMSDTRSFGGVGLGLYLALQTVEAHHGRIDVESTPGEGSTFTVVLPVIA